MNVYRMKGLKLFGNALKIWGGLNQGARASVVYILVTILHTGMGFLMSPIFTRILSEEVYGEVSLFSSYQSIVGVFAMFCLSYGFFDNAMHNYKEDRDRLSFSLLILSNIITLFCFLVCIIIKYFFPKSFNISWALFYLMFFIFFVQPAYNFWVSRQRYEYKYRKSATISIVTTILSPLFAIIFIVSNVFTNDTYNRLLGYYLPLVCVYLFLYVYLAHNAGFQIEKNYWKKAFKFNFPLLPHYLSLYLLNSSDKIMIERYCNKADVAYYSVAVSIASLGTLVWSAINSSLIPYTYDKCENKKYHELNKVVKPIILLVFLVCMLVILFAPEVMWIVAPSSYRNSLSCIPALVGGIIYTVFYHLFANVIYFYSKTQYVLFGSVCSAIVNIVLNLIFIPKYGYLIAGYTTCVSYAAQALIDYWGMKKSCQENVYDNKFMFMVGLATIVVSAVGAVLYKFVFLRYSLIFVFFIMLIVYRNKIFDVVKIIRKR